MVEAAKQHLAEGKNSAAVIELKNALQKKSNDAETRFLLGQALLNSGDAQGAETEFRKALDLGLAPGRVNPKLARALVLRGQFQNVVQRFAHAEAAAPADIAELRTAVGDAQLALGRTEPAQAAFERALAAQPQYAPALLGIAQVRAANGDVDGALKAVDAALAAAPKSVDARYVKGRLLAKKGDRDAAIAEFRHAIESQAAHLPSHAALVALLLQQPDLEPAAKQVEALAKIAPKHPQTLYLQAQIAYRQKDLAAARELIQRQLAAAPDNPNGLILAAVIEHDLKSYAQSESFAVRAAALVPDSPVPFKILASNYIRTGQRDKAQNVLKALLDKYGKDPTVLALAGEFQLVNGQPELAERYFRAASNLDPDDVGKKTGLALTHLAQGRSDDALRELEAAAAGDSDIRADLALIATALRARQFDKALAAIDKLDKKQPGKPMAHNLRALALIGKRDNAGARKSLERALEVDPDYFPAVANLARLDLVERKPEQARQRFEAVLARDPNHSQALLALAELNARDKQKSDETAKLLRKAVAATPNDPTAHRRLIEHFMANKDPKSAVSAAQEALAALPDSPEILDVAGRAYQAAGEVNQAQNTFGRWAKVQPNSPLPMLRLAEIELAAKHRDTAIRHLRRALEIRPDFVEAQRRLIAIELDADRVPQAVAIAKDIQKQRPKEPVGYVLEGDIHAAKKAWKPAVAAYNAGLKEVPASELAIKSHIAYRAGGQQADADRLASSWLKEHGNDRAFRAYLAGVALSSHDYPTAAQHYKTLAAEQPNNPVWLNNLAWVSGQLKDPKAIEYAEKAVSLAPENAAVLDTLGKLLVDSGDVARGLGLLRKASALAPDRPAIRFNLAQALIQSGDKKAARAELEEIAKLGDKFPDQAKVTQLMQQL
jgi:putative PEP-CTERM system TPR-repeat lipoprotein